MPCGAPQGQGSSSRGAGLPLAAQILGHARINSSRPYFALASEQIRQCCLPLQELACTKEGLR